MPGDQSKVVAAMIDVAEADDPPRRLLLGSDAYGLVHGPLWTDWRPSRGRRTWVLHGRRRLHRRALAFARILAIWAMRQLSIRQ
jgi:hypothetical protein